MIVLSSYLDNVLIGPKTSGSGSATLVATNKLKKISEMKNSEGGKLLFFAPASRTVHPLK
jgi:hypothetical protein